MWKRRRRSRIRRGRGVSCLGGRQSLGKVKEGEISVRIRKIWQQGEADMYWWWDVMVHCQWLSITCHGVVLAIYMPYAVPGLWPTWAAALKVVVACSLSSAAVAQKSGIKGILETHLVGFLGVMIMWKRNCKEKGRTITDWGWEWISLRKSWQMTAPPHTWLPHTLQTRFLACLEMVECHLLLLQKSHTYNCSFNVVDKQFVVSFLNLLFLPFNGIACS